MEREHCLLGMPYPPTFLVIQSGGIRETLGVKQYLWCMFFVNTLFMLTEDSFASFIPTHPHPGMNAASCTDNSESLEGHFHIDTSYVITQVSANQKPY